MSTMARLSSWFRQLVARPGPVEVPRQRLAVEELEKREVLSGVGALLPFDPAERFPMPTDGDRFLASGLDMEAQPAVSATNGQDPLADGVRFLAPGEDRGFLSLLRRDEGQVGNNAGGVAPPLTVTDPIPIDAAWLAARGSGPYVLDQASATYVLGTDVRTQGTAFVVAAPNVTLDLNGHTVVYGDSTPLGLRNGGVEGGPGEEGPRWDLSGAPAATLAPNTSHLFGGQVLHLGPFSGIQRIVSGPVAIPMAGRTYTATITPSGVDSTSTLRLTVLDAVTGAVLGSGTSNSTPRGYSAVATFTPLTTDPVQLRIEVIPQSHSSD